MRAIVINLSLYEAAWLACVFGAAGGYPWLGIVVCLTAVGIHLLRTDQLQSELLLISAIVLYGATFDSLLAQSGWISYQQHFPSAAFAPLWIIGLWAAFATIVRTSLQWLKGRSVLAAALGALGGPLAYLAGARLGAIEIIEVWPAAVTLGLGWALLMYVLSLPQLMNPQKVAAGV